MLAVDIDIGAETLILAERLRRIVTFVTALSGDAHALGTGDVIGTFFPTGSAILRITVQIGAEALLGARRTSIFATLHDTLTIGTMHLSIGNLSAARTVASPTIFETFADIDAFAAANIVGTSALPVAA